MVSVSSFIDASDEDFDPFSGGGLERAVPTTESQQEIWLAHQMGPEAAVAYNQVLALRLLGDLVVEALETAVSALVARHESLRSTISADGRDLMVAPPMAVPVRRVDLQEIEEGHRQRVLDDHYASTLGEPFDLLSGPLLRVHLFSIGPREHLLLLITHHIVCDGWSLGVLAKDLAALYSASIGVEGTEVLPPARFSDYAERETASQMDASYSLSEAYWLSRFENGIPSLELPSDFRRPPIRTFSSRREVHVLDSALSADLGRLAVTMRGSLFGVLLGGFAALLARLSGQQEVVIGIPSAGQVRVGMPLLVGHCVNLLPVRIPVDFGRPGEVLLTDTRELLLAALEHQNYAFGTLVRKLNPVRDPSRGPITNVMFNMGRAVDVERLSPVLEAEVVSVPKNYEAFELFVNVVQERDGLRLECQYNDAIYSAQTVRGWLRAYETLLREVLEAPQRILGDMNVVDPAQLGLLSEWNDTRVEYPRTARIHDLVAEETARGPERPAVSCGGDRLRYADLWSRSNRLARALRERGARKGALVGLCLERGTEMLVALLAVLKAGAAYVPLDPAYPSERLAYMAKDAGLALLVTQSSLGDRVRFPRTQTLAIDADASDWAEYDESDLADDRDAARPEDPAYVIYTSGSTGRPKGVVVPHGAVVNFLLSMARRPGMAAGGRLLAVTTLSFDIAVLELLLPLVCGAEVVIAAQADAGDGFALRSLLESSGATVMQATPSTWRMVMESGWGGGPGFTALVGGEALQPDLAAELLARVDALWNMYGPTETTIWSTAWRVEKPEEGISIGTPIANTTVWIQDDRGGLCAIGTPGEICIGGDGVTIGYLNRAELTAERYVADTHGFRPGGRLYRTGDLGRWRHDGLLEHLGRIDHQVKVRGYRIELGEIEASLSSHPAVRSCVAVTRELRHDDTRIVAYWVADPGSVTADELRTHLRATLPDYMVPQHFVRLDSLPLLPNGKVNRSALPEPVASRETDAEVEGPELETPSELLIADVWSRLLQVNDISADDNFFNLGGHSMLAMEAIVSIKQLTGVRLSPQQFVFESLAQLAHSIDSAAAMPKRGLVGRLLSKARWSRSG